ncbi:hypothetical protein B0O80DRAFT_457725 [Mortierella sp. GBAus27b]|nr:hypothetical protein BGX31_007037 [Mortierella sp. GBA43]KAI8350421.1 hypothetical protein B0O80DRAFT_457725 [Mortierella sp. GBAus27b]
MSSIIRTIALHSRAYLQRPVSGSVATVHHTARPVLQPFTARTWANRTFTTGSPRMGASEKEPSSKKMFLAKDPYLLSNQVVKLANKGRLDEAITLVNETPMNRQSEVVWNHLIQESSKLGKGNQAWRLLSDMKKRGFEPSERTYTILLNSLANTSSPNSVPRAKVLYQQMVDSEDTPPTSTHTNALLKVCARKSDYRTLQEVYDNMPKSGPRAPNVVTFNIMINSFARMGGDEGFEKAWKVWEDCLEAKMERPDEVSLDSSLVDAVLLACREADSVSLAKRGRRIVESLYGLGSSTSGPADSDTEAKSMSITERAISPSKGLGLGPILQQETIRPRTVDLLLSTYTKFKDYDKAEQVLGVVRTTYSDFKPDSQLIASMMHLHIIRKDYGKAIQAWDEIKALRLQHTPATFKQGLDASLKDRNWEKTLEMYTDMRKLIAKNRGVDTTSHRPMNPIVNQQDAWTLVSTVKCAVKTKHIPEAVQILHESKWVKVVQNPQYPRANADLAELAVKVYSLALQKERSSNGTEALDSREAHGKVELLERDLLKAKDLRAVLTVKLGKYDANRWEHRNQQEDEDEDEENDIISTHQHHSPRLSTQSGFKENDGMETIVSDEPTGYREPKRRVQRSTPRRDSSRRSGIKSQQWTGSRGRRDEVEDAFQPSRSFSREVS